ncbi:MAG TPA: 4'-phosphopantetheinyl transferase superfamily protein [Rhodoblastus sp.]|nr:4'-phosphopantetheinyl transferase superfamily protein [Rhodoblastus sp.]
MTGPCAQRAELRAASGAARVIARELLSRLGANCPALIKDIDGVPIWPCGMVGSLAHDATHAMAAVAREEDVLALGADLEPDSPLAPEMLDLIATPAERARYDEDLLRSPTLFVVKEAVYKAIFPRERRFLDFHEIEVDLGAGRAYTRSGAIVEIALAGGRQICALAVINAANYTARAKDV